MPHSSLILGALLLSISFCGTRTDSMPPTPDSSARSRLSTRASSVARYFAARSAADREAANDAVTAELGDDLSRLPQILHGAGLHQPIPSGRGELVVPDVGHGHGRRVYLHVPRGYDPSRAHPLLLAYHPGGGSGQAMLGSALRMLGSRAEEFLVAAPHHYRQTGLDHPRPVSSEHAEVLRSLKEHLHVDSDRVYVTGFSTGGYTAWHLATLQPDLFAGAIPMAATFSVPLDLPGLAEQFFPNLRHVPVLSVWGGRDSLNVPGLNGRRTRDTMARLNRRLGPMLERAGLDQVVHHEIPGAGHGGYGPPEGPLDHVLMSERVRSPREVLLRFRYVHQAHAYWVEGHEWEGSLWETPWPPTDHRSGGRGDQATLRAILERLGEIRAEAEGQTFRVDTKHLADLTVWLDDTLVTDWSRPVVVVHNGTTVFEGKVQPDPGVALAQARRTWDFDRIRWAGIRVDAVRGTARVVTAEDELPPVLREVVGR